MLTDAEYDNAMRRIEILMTAAPGSPEEDELSRLVEQVEEYEQHHWPIGKRKEDH